jgi:hypothetical protein
MGLLRLHDFAGLRIGLLDHAPFVPALGGHEATTETHGVAPHRLGRRFLEARVERELGWLFLFPTSEE